MHMRMCDLVNKIPRGKKRKIVEQIIEERKRAWMDKNPEGQLDQREVVVDDGSDINTDGEVRFTRSVVIRRRRNRKNLSLLRQTIKC